MVIERLMRRLRGTGARAAAIPPGLRVYAVGDIHGRADLLAAMAGLVARDLEMRPVARRLTIFLGDYMDRGPDTAGVIDRLARGDFPTALVALRGNHDAIFLDLMAGRTELDYFAQIGGSATLASYGIDIAHLATLPGGERDAALQRAIPAGHLAFLAGTRLSVEVGDYFFCHAGVRPGVALEAQSADDLMWIREDFLRSSADFGRVVVHGHTPVKTPDARLNRINVDTQAFASGMLTAVVLEGDDRRFLQTSAQRSDA